MYREHFGLVEPPFRITPNTGCFFEGGKRGPTLDALEFAVLHDEGITKVSGEVGSGKTMLCRMLLKRLPKTVDTIYLANPTLGPEDLLRLVAEELSIEAPSDNPGVRLIEIQKDLVARFAAGRRVVALVDEAHAMPPASLEQVRLLSNLETDEHKLLQIVLFGQPELDEILQRQAMRQLRDRITQHFRLTPLAPTEVADYLGFRLRTAGYRGPELFARSAASLLARASAGLSRRINVLADKALLSAYSRGAHQVKRTHVEEAIRDAEYPLPPRRWPIAALAGVAGAVLIGWLLTRSAADPGARPEVPANAPPASLSTNGPRADGQTDATANALPSAATQPSAPAQTATPRATNATDAADDRPPAIPGPAATSPDAAAPITAQAHSDAPTAASAADATVATRPAVEPIALGPIARALNADTARWVDATSPDHWFIQLRTVDGARADDIERFISRLPDAVARDWLRVYVRDLGWGARVGVIYGEFVERDEAVRAMLALPEALRRDGIYPRQVKGLR